MGEGARICTYRVNGRRLPYVGDRFTFPVAMVRFPQDEKATC